MSLIPSPLKGTRFLQAGGGRTIQQTNIEHQKRLLKMVPPSDQLVARFGLASVQDREVFADFGERRDVAGEGNAVLDECAVAIDGALSNPAELPVRRFRSMSHPGGMLFATVRVRCKRILAVRC